jgi:dsRNA-specific ribonuclease
MGRSEEEKDEEGCGRLKREIEEILEKQHPSKKYYVVTDERMKHGEKYFVARAVEKGSIGPGYSMEGNSKEETLRRLAKQARLGVI